MLKNLNLSGYKALNIYATLFVLAALVLAGYAQIDKGLEPCPLCVMQRILFAIVGLLFLGVAIHTPKDKGRKIYHWSIFIFIFLGIAISSRHIYLQSLPANLAPSCGPGLNFIVQNLPTSDVLRAMFLGTGHCAKVSWDFLGLTLPEWSFLGFIFFGALNLIQLLRKNVVCI